MFYLYALEHNILLHQIYMSVIEFPFCRNLSILLAHIDDPNHLLFDHHNWCDQPCIWVPMQMNINKFLFFLLWSDKKISFFFLLNDFTLNGTTSYSKRNMCNCDIHILKSPSVNSYAMLNPNEPNFLRSNNTEWNKHKENTNHLNCWTLGCTDARKVRISATWAKYARNIFACEQK